MIHVVSFFPDKRILLFLFIEKIIELFFRISVHLKMLIVVEWLGCMGPL